MKAARESIKRVFTKKKKKGVSWTYVPFGFLWNICRCHVTCANLFVFHLRTEKVTTCAFHLLLNEPNTSPVGFVATTSLAVYSTNTGTLALLSCLPVNNRADMSG